MPTVRNMHGLNGFLYLGKVGSGLEEGWGRDKGRTT